MKVLLIVPDGVAVRNYLYSSFIAELEKLGAEVMLYHQISNKAIEEVKLIQKNVKLIRQIPLFIESPSARLLRESAVYARLILNKRLMKNYTIMDFWNSKSGGFKKKALYSIAELLGSLVSGSYKAILKLENLYEKEILKDKVVNEIEKDLKDLKPDFLLNLHQRSPVTSPVICAASKLKIKTGTIIFSWDNVPKGRLISRYDKYFVWSKLMKEELGLLYPEISKNDIEIVGTPQFEFYFQANLIKEKATFFAEHGLDPNKKTICFSGNDSTSPYEANYLEDLGSELSKVNDQERPQILFRKCPVDKSDRFDQTLEKYKFIVSIEPDWRLGDNNTSSFTTIYPSYNDLHLLVNTVKHSDIVINFGSTMAHDFATYDKPCLYLNYDPVKDSTYKVSRAYDFQHFKSLSGIDAVGWINGKTEFIPKIKEVLESPNQIGMDKKKWMKRIVEHPLQENSRNLADKIYSLCTSVS